MMLMMLCWLWCFFVVACGRALLIVSVVGGAAGTTDKYKQYMRTINFVNESPSDIEIYWVNPTTSERKHFDSMRVGDSFPIDTYVGHVFRLEEVGTSDRTDKKKLSCLNAPKRRCRSVSIVVQGGDAEREKVIRINGKFELQEEQALTAMSSPDSNHVNDSSGGNPKKKKHRGGTGGSSIATASRTSRGHDAAADASLKKEGETTTAAAAANYSRNKLDLVVWNDSPFRVEVYLLASKSKTKKKKRTKRKLLSEPGGVAANAIFPFESYEGDVVELVEVPNSVSNEGCAESSPTGGCRTTRFAVPGQLPDREAKVIRVGTDFDVVDFVTEADMNRKRRARKRNLNGDVDNDENNNDVPKVPLQSGDDVGALVAKCKALAAQRTAAGADADADADEGDEGLGLMECVERGLAGRLELYNEEISFQAEVRTNIAYKLENYTCSDDALDTSPDVEATRAWRKRTVHVKHRRPSSQIHVIENFILDDECEAMEEAAAPDLQAAVVADGKGATRVTENRKAMQAAIKVPWDKEADDHPIARLSRRVYDYANHVLGLNIQEFGQEDLMSIQYAGRGRNDTEPDQYTPHCDGPCKGMPHQHASRVATMVMYCDIPEDGGHTNFRNAGVHVKPETGNAVFFSYIDPETKIMDSGFTEHSGCPVFRGEKKIVTQWIRLGVDGENPWNSFNTLGIKRSEVDDDEKATTTTEDDDAIKTTTNHSRTTTATHTNTGQQDQSDDFSALREAAAAALREAAAAATTTEAEIRDEL